MKLFSKLPKGNLVFITELLIEHLKVKVCRSTISVKLNEHPEFPSLLALSDCLSEWKIDNSAFQFDNRILNSNQLSYPFVAHLSENGGRFILIHSLKDNTVLFSDEKSKNQQIPLSNFEKRWSGILLLAIKNARSGELNYIHNKFNDLIKGILLPTSLLTLFIIIYLLLFQFTISFPYLFLCLIKFTGLTITILLLVQSISFNNPFVQNLCSIGEENGCNDILKTDASQITSWLSWSEIGYSYFAGTFLCLLLIPASSTFLIWLNVFALPYTLYSLKYQYENKTWCTLCCLIQILLWIEFFVNIFGIKYNRPILNTEDVLKAVISFSIPILVWMFFKPFLISSSQINVVKQRLKRFTTSGGLFNKILINQQRYDLDDDITPIKLGNNEARTILTIVSNPFCKPCARAHIIIDKLLQSRNDITIKVVFLVMNNADNPHTQVSKHLIALGRLDSNALVNKALNDWYRSKEKKYDKWAEKYPTIIDEDMSNILQKQKEWCEMAHIVFTPTILINGFKLPEAYNLEDIQFLI